MNMKRGNKSTALLVWRYVRNLLKKRNGVFVGCNGQTVRMVHFCRQYKHSARGIPGKKQERSRQDNQSLQTTVRVSCRFLNFPVSFPEQIMIALVIPSILKQMHFNWLFLKKIELQRWSRRYSNFGVDICKLEQLMYVYTFIIVRY